MSNSTNLFRAFSLYDFFSVFLPGMALIIGISPFVPYSVSNSISITGGLLLLFIGSFVAGQAIHGVAVQINDAITESHRQVFNSRLKEERETGLVCPIGSEDDDVDVSLRNLFDSTTKKVYGFNYDRDSLDSEYDVNPDSVYKLVRSYVAMEGRGKSRHLQAIYAFSRSMWLTLLILGLMYIIITLISISNPGSYSSPFVDFINKTPGNPWVRPIGIIVTEFAAMLIFHTEACRYKKIYIDYLISDFINSHYIISQSRIMGNDGKQNE